MKNKIGFVLLFVSVVAFLMIITSTKASTSIKDNIIPIQTLETMIEDKEEAFVLIGNRNCTSCQKFLPTLEKAAAKTDTEVYYLDTENNSNKKFIVSNNVTVTPTMLVIREGKVIRSEGAMEYEKVKKMLEKGEVE